MTSENAAEHETVESAANVSGRGVDSELNDESVSRAGPRACT
ncbi:hypothetical protein AB5J72_48420 [Streptomyces sp. CG1]